MHPFSRSAVALTLAAAVFLCVGPAHADKQATQGDGLLADCAFASAYNQSWCTAEQGRFVEQYRRSLNRDYQSQRSVASCLISGCDGAVIVNRSLGCAWRLVILASESPYIDLTDESNRRYDCARLDGPGETALARRQAEALLRLIYDRPLPAEQ